jgi:photosystem II stability/assembly factor-like uncharacterized protein
MADIRVAARVFVVGALLAMTIGACGGSSSGPQPHSWTFLGPAPVFDSLSGTPIRFSGRIDVAVPDPSNHNVMYVGGSGGGDTAGSGVWKTTNWEDANPTWQPLTDKLPSLSIFGKSLALGGGVLYGAAQGPNGGILRSTDGGMSWEYLAQVLFANALFGAIAVNPADPDLVYAAVGGNTVHGLFRSSDGGVNWVNITEHSIGLGAASDVVIDPDAPAVIYTGVVNGTPESGATHGGIYKSTDGGDSWTRMSLPAVEGFEIGSFIALRMAPFHPDYVYAAVFGSQNSAQSPQLQRFRTADAGANWRRLTLPEALPPNFCSQTEATPAQDFRYWHVVLGVSPADPNLIYANACEPNFVMSTDGGGTWTHLSRDVDDVVNVFFDDSDNLVLVGDRGIHSNSDPPSMPFASKQGNLGNFLIHTLALDPLNPSIIDAVSQDQLSGIQYTGSMTWNYLPAGEEVGRFRINPTNDSQVYVWGYGRNEVSGPTPTPKPANQTFLDRSGDKGQTWTDQTDGLNQEDFANRDDQEPYNAFILDPANPAHLVLGGQHVWQATDIGPGQPLTWNEIGTAPSPGSQITAIAVAGTAAQTIYVATEDGRVFVTSDGAATWADISPQPDFTGATTTAIVVDPNNPSQVFINTVIIPANPWELDGSGPPLSGRIWMTTSSGVSWTNIDAGLPSNFRVYSLAADFTAATPRLFAGTDRGVFWSADLGTHWTTLNSGLPNVMVNDLELLPDSGILAAGTFGRGVWRTVIPGH